MGAVLFWGFRLPGYSPGYPLYTAQKLLRRVTEK